MAGHTRRPTALEWQVFRGTDAVRSGLVTANDLRGRSWQRLRHDVYADSRLDRDHALACFAAALTLPADAVIAGRSAAFRYGVDHAAGFHDPVHVVVPPVSTFGRRNGLIVHRAAIAPSEIADVGPHRCTTPARTAWDVAMWHDRPTAVAILDGLLATDTVTAGQLSQFCEERTGLRGHRRARIAFDLADARSQSPPESRLRVRLAEADFPTPTPQCPVTVDTGVLLHLDLGWPEFKVGLEYDGQWHASADQLYRDRRRLNLLQGAGWIVLHATSERLSRDFAGLAREIRAALAARGWRPRSAS
jgi:hypothetical protein